MDTAIAFSLITITMALFVCMKHRPKQRSVGELPPPSETVCSSLTKREKIAAIRHYRNQTGASLYEASKVIEHYEARLHHDPS